MAINKNKNTRIVITLPKEVKEQVQELANKDNRTMTNYIVNLILKDLESKKSSFIARLLFLLVIVIN